MSEQSPMQPGSFCWTELMTRDVAAAKKFYSELVGWKLADQAMGGFTYTTITTPGTECSTGGMMQMDGPQFEGVPPHWMPYIAVASVDDKAKQCAALGGKVVMPPMDIPNVGRFCVIEDPTGAKISLFQGG